MAVAAHDWEGDKPLWNVVLQGKLRGAAASSRWPAAERDMDSSGLRSYDAQRQHH